MKKQIQVLFMERMIIFYLYLPVIVFFITWVRPLLSIPASLIICFSCYRYFMDCRTDDKKLCVEVFNFCQVKYASISIVLVSLGLLLAGVLSGWGGWLIQSDDWGKHNAVLNDLIQYNWPVYYKDAASPSMLTYYIGQYLIPALFGKMTNSFYVGSFCLFVWLEIGLFFVVFYMIGLLELHSSVGQVLVVLVMILFGGCLFGAQKMFRIISGTPSFDYHFMMSWGPGSNLQIRSIFVALRWVPTQAIPCWLAVLLLWNHRKEVENYALYALPVMLSGIIPFLGLVIIMIVCIAVEVFGSTERLQEKLRKVFSLENIGLSLFCGGIILVYYWGNVFGEKPDALGIKFQSLTIGCYLSFTIFMFVLYSIISWSENRKNPLLIGANLVLLTFPFFSMGTPNDLYMCITIPAFFVVTLCVLRELIFLMRKILNKKRERCSFIYMVKVMMLIPLLLFSAYYSLKEMKTVVRESIIVTRNEDVWKARNCSFMALYKNNTMRDTSDKGSYVLPDYIYNYYTYDMEECPFVRYVAIKK